MDGPREVKNLPAKCGMERREFLRKVLAAAVGLPAATALLSGCDGDGLLHSPDDGAGPAPQGDLGDEVEDMRAAIAATIGAVAGLTDADDADLGGRLAQINAQLAVVWPLMVSADQQALRANVSPEMQQVLDQLDDFEVGLNYAGAAPQITPQMLRDAWERAEGLLQTQAAADQPYATERTWIFFLLLFLMFPGIAGVDAFNFAMAAGSMDSDEEAARLHDMLHPLGSIPCTPCFFSGLLTRLVAVIMLLFMAAGSQMGGASAMLFGRDFPIMLVLLAALLVLFIA